MHKCLCIPEILTLIAEFAHKDADHLSVASMAMTCQTFAGPALDILWHYQESVVPLIRTLPSSLLEETEEAVTGHLVMSFKRPMKPSDWSRFVVYAPRVKMLRLGLWYKGRSHSLEGVLSKLDLDTYRGVAPIETTALLPNLQLITIDPPHWYIFPHIPLLFGPRTVTVTLAFAPNQTQDTLRDVLNAIRHKSPHIGALQVTECDFMNDDELAEYSNFICGMSDLRLLAFEPELPHRVWAHLASVPFSVIKLTLPPAHLGLLSTSLPSTPFSALGMITLTISDSGSWTDFTSCLSSPLEILNLDLKFVPTVADLRSCFSTVERFSPTLSIFTFRQVSMELFVSESDIPLPNDTLIPLLKLHKLQKLRLNFAPFPDIDDAFMNEMARSWPEIWSLDLTSCPVWGGHSNITLNGLVPFARYCPELTSIGIAIDAGGELPDPPDNLCHKNLKEIRVAVESEIEDPEGVAAFLTSLFSSLAIVTTDEDDNQHSIDLWSDVENRLQNSILFSSWDSIGETL
ncbi:hypothetical protein JAAARDRAFT_191719 [Jaapia argillacea MUCL 33604]|uniref:F-box domain-containing protein n=1 Tax=Jaapia argillacea MUCL 33604 TaxID=933084 RepID=A0A067Q9X8_9AGAM|nr:hypothetical protein JAAARDRAFT_191719 [Jaapia argillacea MUCL 33604]